MPTFRNPFHRPDDSTDTRFSAWTDQLVDSRSLPGREAALAPDPDFADVAETATTVHRAVGTGAASPFPADRSDAIWEQLMNTTTVSPTVLPGATIGNGPPSTRPDRLATTPQPGWQSYVLTATLIAAIVVAGFAAIWRITDPFTGSGPGTTDQPGFLAQDTPASTETSCDLTNDIPYFVDAAPDAPFIATYALLDDDGTLTLNCEGASKVVANEVEQAAPFWWPGAIALAMRDGTVQLVNLFNGATVGLESDPLLDDDGRFTDEIDVYVSAQYSPWLISAANPDLTDWRVTDLRSMESFLLSDEVGGPLTESHRPVLLNSPVTGAAGANGNETAVVSFFPDRMTPPPYAATESTPPKAVTPDGNTLVLPGSIDDRRWIATDDAAWLSGVSGSADGSLLAYPAVSEAEEPMIRVEQTLDGRLVAEVPYDPNAGILSFLLAGAEPSLVISDGATLDTVTWEPELEGVPINYDPRVVTGLYPTTDPNVVLMVEARSVVPIDIATGAAGEPFQYVPSLIQQLQFIDGYSQITNIINVVSDALGDVPSTIQIVDPDSGEVLVQSDPVDVHPIVLTRGNIVSLVKGGSLAVAPISEEGRAIVLDAATGDTWEVSIPAEASSDDEWLFTASRDGRLIYAVSFSQYVMGEDRAFYLAEAVPDAEWIEVEAGSPARYIVGTHGLPDTGKDELATLDAQEVTPLDGSPVATPAG